jgi:hypothetical protein
MMRVLSSRVFEMSLCGGSVRRVRREVRLVMVDGLGVHMRRMTIYGKDVEFGTWPVLSDGIGEGSVFIRTREEWRSPEF